MGTSGQIILPYGTAAETPSSGKVTLYPKSDKLIYIKNDEGTEYILSIHTLLNLSDTPIIYDDGKYLKSTTSGTEWATTSGSNHYELNNLDYVSAGHTGFASSDDLSTTSGILRNQIDNLDYYTTAEVTTISGGLQSQLDDKSDTGHIHDDRYYTETEVDNLYTTLSGDLSDEIDSDIVTFSGTIDHDTILNTHNLTTDIDHNQLKNFSIDEHRLINDSAFGVTDLWSAQKIDNELDDITTISGVLDDHNHFDNLDGGMFGEYYHLTESEHTALTSGIECTIHKHDDRYYTELEIDTISGSLSNEIDSDISTHSSSGDHDWRYYTETEVDTISGSLQTNIDGKSDTSHLHDDRYYTESEVDTISGSLQTNIDGKSDTGHSHDDRYYTETEIDTISGSLQTNIDSKASVLIDLNDTPDSYDDGKYLRSTINGAEWATVSGTGTSDVQMFLDLTDTPTTYSGYAGRYLKVSLDESELEYASIQGTATTTISGWDVYDATTYYGDFEHNLGTEELSVFIVDTATNKAIGVENIEIISENTVRIYVIEDTLSLKVNVITGGIGTATGAGTNTVGLVDDAWVQIDDTDAADNDYARFTTSGIEGRNYSEVLEDLSGQASTTFSFNDKGLQRANLLDCGIVTNEIGSIGGGSQTIDIENGNSVSAIVDTAETTFTFSNPTASGVLCAFSFVLTNGGSQTVNWPASADWEDGTAPTLTANGVDILVFSTIDGGTAWHGSTFSLDSK